MHSLYIQNTEKKAKRKQKSKIRGLWLWTVLIHQLADTKEGLTMLEKWLWYCTAKSMLSGNRDDLSYNITTSKRGTRYTVLYTPIFTIKTINGNTWKEQIQIGGEIKCLTQENGGNGIATFMMWNINEVRDILIWYETCGILMQYTLM